MLDTDGRQKQTLTSRGQVHWDLEGEQGEGSEGLRNVGSFLELAVADEWNPQIMK